MGALIADDLLFPAEAGARSVARDLYAAVKNLPIVSPHGHTDPRWYALDEPFPDPAQLLIVPDHYIFRMLFSQGVRLEDLGVPTLDGSAVETDGRTIWRRFAENYLSLSRHADAALVRLCADRPVRHRRAADGQRPPTRITTTIAALLQTDAYRPRALFKRFNIEAIATTEGALDDLKWHRMIRDSGWDGRVVTAYRPDGVVDPDFEGFAANLDKLGEITGCGHRHLERAISTRIASVAPISRNSARRRATTAIRPPRQANLSDAAAEELFNRIRRGSDDERERRLFRAQMLTEMAKMSLDDGLVLQIHPGSWRNHSPAMMQKFGRDKGFDIPTRTDYVAALKPLLDAVGTERNLTVIVFTLDETSYARELAPLAGVYPALKLGPAWWFHDSPEGMRRFREMTTETAGFYNTVGFNDDTRAFPSIPARHDVARRVDCAFLARLVSEHRLREDEAHELAQELAYTLAKKAYRL